MSRQFPTGTMMEMSGEMRDIIAGLISKRLADARDAYLLGGNREDIQLDTEDDIVEMVGGLTLAAQADGTARHVCLPDCPCDEVERP